MRAEHAVEGLLVSGPYGVGVLCRMPNGWDLVVEERVYQHVDLATHEPWADPVEVVEVRSSDSVSPKVRGRSGT